MIKMVRHRYSSKKCLSNRVPDSSMTDFKWSQIPSSHKSFQEIIFQPLLHYVLLKKLNPQILIFVLPLLSPLLSLSSPLPLPSPSPSPCHSLSLLTSPFLLLFHPSLSPILLCSDLHSIFVTQESLYIFDLVIISQYILFQFNVLCPAHP